MSDMIGKNFGRYQLIEQLGKGGMANVYKAYDSRLDRYVAVKVIITSQQQSESFIKRFEREAKALAKLTHPNIVDIHDYGEQDGIPYLVMEYLPGGTLKKLLGKPLHYKEAARLLIPMADALQIAHKQNIIHRDIKPANILLTDSGIPMLTDFGIAKILASDEQTALTGVGVGIGTPEYMAPEQGQGINVDHRADIYALGVVFFELVTGNKPYRADTPLSVIMKHIQEPLPRPRAFISNLPTEVENLIFKSMAKKPEDRYRDMTAFSSALEGLLEIQDKKEPTQLQDDQATMIKTASEQQATVAYPEVESRQQTGGAAIPPPIIRQPEPMPRQGKTEFYPAYAPPAPKRKKILPWIIGGGVLVLIIVCVAIAGGSGLLMMLGMPTSTSIPVAQATKTDAPIPPTATVLVPTDTPIPPPTAQPIAMPAIANDTRAREAYQNNEFDGLYDRAPERYTADELNTIGNVSYYSVILSGSEPLFWFNGWCATTEEILNSNLDYIHFEFEMNGTPLEASRASFNKGESSSGQYCLWLYFLIEQWPSGQHHLVNKIVIEQPLNDGGGDYQPGSLTSDYIVTVN